MSSTLLLYFFFFPQTQVEFVCPAAVAGNSCNSSTSAGRKKKGPKGGIVVTVTKPDLWPAPHWGEHKQEKVGERGRERPGMVISSIVQPAPPHSPPDCLL